MRRKRELRLTKISAVKRSHDRRRPEISRAGEDWAWQVSSAGSGLNRGELHQVPGQVPRIEVVGMGTGRILLVGLITRRHPLRWNITNKTGCHKSCRSSDRIAVEQSSLLATLLIYHANIGPQTRPHGRARKTAYYVQHQPG